MGTSLSEVLEIVVKTDPGMVRSNNEDAVMANSLRGFAVLADGMGGYNAGEVASGPWPSVSPAPGPVPV